MDIAIGEARHIPDEIFERFAVFQDAQIRQMVALLFTKLNEFLDVNQERDKFVATNALKQSGNGVILMGIKHRSGVQAGLEASCQNERLK